MNPVWQTVINIDEPNGTCMVESAKGNRYPVELNRLCNVEVGDDALVTKDLSGSWIMVDISKKYPHKLVLSADTIVVIDNQIIGKPVDEVDAKRILNLLSNRTHQVFTAFYLIKDNKEYEEVVISEVTFNELSKQLIDDYIKSGSPMDKAGAYGAQDNNDFKLIKNISGSVTNVIGFPVDEIKEAIKNF